MKLFGKKIEFAKYFTQILGFQIAISVLVFLLFPGFVESELGITRGASLMAAIFGLSCLSLYLNRLKIHALILKSFIGPFMVAFSVILFILVLQFLAKYMEDIMGKGFGPDVLGKVFVYACMTLVTMALPLGVLLSSLLTLGNMGERYELAALKSSGVGLFKAIRPLVHATLVVTVGSVFFSFFIMPMANLKLYTLLHDLGKVKPTFALEENHFYAGIDNMVLHVGRKDPGEVEMLHMVKIYDHSKTVGNNSITLAERGTIVPSKATGFLDIDLYNGTVYEFKGPESVGVKGNQVQVFEFEKLHYAVPLEGFDLEESEEDPFQTHQYMLNFFELDDAVDSMYAIREKNLLDYADFNRKYVHVDTLMNRAYKEVVDADTTTYGSAGRIEPDLKKDVWEWFPDMQKRELLEKTVGQTTALGNYTRVMEDRLARGDEKRRKFQIELHTRLMLPVSCVVFLLLGASLGAIIRKGGIGIPVIFSIVFFILFYILMIQGKKLARDEILPLWVGVWLPMLVMAPMGIFFTYQSATESKILYGESWYRLWRFLVGWMPWFKRRQGQRNTLSVEELVALRQRYKDEARKKIEDHQKRE